MCGINFEPTCSTDELRNIVINNAQTGSNAGYGIQIGYSNLYAGSNKTSNIVINNPNDKRSNVAFKAAANIAHRVGSEILSGQLVINNPIWRLNASSPIVGSIAEKNIKLTITKPSVEDANGIFYNPLTLKGALARGVSLLGGHTTPIIGYVIDSTISGGVRLLCKINGVHHGAIMVIT